MDELAPSLMAFPRDEQMVSLDALMVLMSHIRMTRMCSCTLVLIHYHFHCLLCPSWLVCWTV